MTSSAMSVPNAVIYPDLANKVAVVTGGSRGIGAATAKALAINGVSVALVGRDQAAIDATVGTIDAGGGRAVGVVADCTVDSDVAAVSKCLSNILG